MGLLDRLDRWRRPRPPAAVEGAREQFSAEIPGLAGVPLLRLELQSERRPEADGERLHLRLRVQSNLASALRPMLNAPPPPASAQTALATRASTGQRLSVLGRRALAVPAVRALAERLLAHDLNTFLDVQASTASLAQGSRALLPSPERLAALGIQPDWNPEAEPLQAWAHQDARGFAQLALLRLDPEHWPPALREALGGAPLSLVATLVQTAERKPEP
jgi:hypothetical protein